MTMKTKKKKNDRIQSFTIHESISSLTKNRNLRTSRILLEIFAINISSHKLTKKTRSLIEYYPSIIKIRHGGVFVPFFFIMYNDRGINLSTSSKWLHSVKSLQDFFQQFFLSRSQEITAEFIS